MQRSAPGALLYFVAYALTVLTTPFEREHSLFVLLSGVLIFVLGSLRLLGALRLRNGSDELVASRISAFRVLIYVQFAAWGLFCALTLSLYGLIPAAFMMLLFTVGLASGAAGSLSSDYILGRRAIFLMTAPIIVPSLAMRTTFGNTLAVVIGLFTIYLMVQVKQNWTSRREANRLAALDAVRATEERLREMTAKEEKSADEKRQKMTEVLLNLWRTSAVQPGGLEDNLREIARIACDTLEVERVNIWQPTDDRKRIRCLVLYEKASGSFSSGTELEVTNYPNYFRHLDAHRTIASDDARTDPRTEELLKGYIRPLQITSMMDSSIRMEDGQLGVICHEHIGPPRHWSAEEQAFAASLGDLIAMTITRSRQTEAEQQQRQNQKLEALGVLAGGIAHDFNNILAAINGFAELALRDMPEGSISQYRLEQILRAGGRAADLVRQILAFSSRGERPTEIVKLSKVTNEVLGLLRASIPASIEIVAKVKQDGHVLASVIEVQQILINLCTNAYQAMKDSGRIEIEIDVVGRYVCLSVSDTGPGIDAKTLERIFDPFFTTKPVDEGTGLGLAVVHGIVHYYGGSIDVASTPGQGACFKVYLPLCEVSDLQTTEPQADLRRGTEHILFADDEDTLVTLWKEVLEYNGYTVTCARNGEEALALFKESPEKFDLVLTDVTMPKMSGPDLVREILSIKPALPVLMSTGYNDVMITGSLRNLGIRGTLAKPCPTRLLLAAVREALDVKAPRGATATT